MRVQAKSNRAWFASASVAFAFVISVAAATPAPAQTAGIDPGQSAIVEAPQDALRFSSEGLSEVEAPGGGVTVNLEGRFKHYLVAHKGPDGKVHVGCTQDPAGEHVHEVPGVEGAQ